MATSELLEGDVHAMSADEIALYDRQIRLWGMDAQQRLRNANVLLVNVRALGNEIAKNLVLGGIGSLTLVDDQIVTAEDLGSQFFLTREEIGKPRALAAQPRIQELNNRVKVYVETRDILGLEPSFFATFDLTIATDLLFSQLSTLNAAVRFSGRPFYAAGSHGFCGFVFADLVEHTYVISRDKSNIVTKTGRETVTRSVISSTEKIENGKTIELVTKREVYQPLILANTSPLESSILRSRRRLRGVTPLLPCLRALWEFEKTYLRSPRTNSPDDLALFAQLSREKIQELQLPGDVIQSDFLRRFLQNLGSEIVAMTSILGAQLAQDVINVLSGREQPIQNLLLFDGEESVAPIFVLNPLLPSNDAILLNGGGP